MLIKYGAGIIITHCIYRRASVISVSLRAAAYPGIYRICVRPSH